MNKLPDPPAPGALDAFVAKSWAKLQARIDRWLTTLGLVDGWKWWDWPEWSVARPRGIVHVLTAEDGDRVYRGAEELNALVDPTIFHWEWETYSTFGFYINTFEHTDLAAYVAEQQELDWIRGLVAPDLAAVHRDVFDWFATRGHTLSRLHWRELEELIAASFASQGMAVELGPGRADGGIDLRLARHDVFGDVLTAVQVKGGTTPIRLHYVQALAAAAVADESDESIFVTASRYLPGVRNWVRAWEAKTQHRLTLASPGDVEQWCAAARDRVWLPDKGLRDPMPRGAGDLVGRVMSSSDHYRITTNSFGLVVRQTERAVLLRLLNRRIVEGDIQMGREVPVLPTEESAEAVPKYVAARWIDLNDHAALFDTEGDLWSPWNGEPMAFTLMD
jgi:restriction system protein